MPFLASLLDCRIRPVMLSFFVPVPRFSPPPLLVRFSLSLALPVRARQLTVESTKLKAVEDVPLLPLAGPFFEGKNFPTGDAAKMVNTNGQ